MVSMLSPIREKLSFSLPSLRWSGSRRKTTTRLDKRTVFYLIYGLLVFLVVFSGNYFSSRIEPLIRAELQKQQQYNIQILSIDPNLFPPSIELAGIDVRAKQTGAQLAKLDDVRVKLDLFSLLKSRIALQLDVSAYGALFSGTIGTGLLFNINDFMADFDCENISLSNIPAVKALNLGLSGDGHISLDLKGTLNDLSTYTGVVHFDLASPAFNGIPPLFKVPKVQVDSLDGAVSLDKLVLTLKEMKLNGASLAGEMAGNITIDPSNINNSKLDLKGQVKADLALFNEQVIVQKKAIALMKAKKAIPVEITDTLGKPWVALVD